MEELINGFEAYNRSQFSYIPQTIRNTTIKDIKLIFDNSRTLGLTGKTEIGGFEVQLKYMESSKNDFLLGFSPNKGFKLSALNENLIYIDKVDLQNIAVVYCYSKNNASKIGLDLLNDFELGSETVSPGLTLLGTREISSSLPVLKRINSIIVKADIPSDKTASIKLTGKPSFQDLDLGLLIVKDATVSVEPKSKKSEIALSVEANIPEIEGGHDKLILTGSASTDGTGKNGNLTVFMNDGEVWNTPFGLPGTKIGDFGLEVGVDGPGKRVGVRGVFKLGNIEAITAGALDTKNYMNSMISVSPGDIDFNTVMNNYFTSNVARQFTSLPKNTMPGQIRNSEFTIIPSPMTIANKKYDPGIRITGQGEILELEADLDILAAYDSGFRGSANLKPISLPSGSSKIFDIGGQAQIDLTAQALVNPNHSFLSMNSNVSILEFNRNVAIGISKNGFSFSDFGKIFNLFTARIKAKGKNLHTPNNMDLNVSMESDFAHFVQNNSKEIFKQSTTAKREAFKQARNAVKAAERALDKGKLLYDNALTKRAKKTSAYKAANGAVNTAKNGLNKAEDAVDDAWGDLGGVAKKIAGSACNVPGIKHLCRAVDAAQRKVDDKIGLRDKADKALNLAKEAVTAAKDNLNPLEAALATAKSSLNALETASDFTTQAAKRIIEKGTDDLLRIEQASFSGSLSQLNGGSVEMNCNVLFLNQQINTTLPFNFKNPSAFPKELVETLLENRGNEGWLNPIIL